eukprot:CAMPEP_0195577904 /NCGR_PEP_ID=MMETSP0814-20130614/11154_1 /TAXON_ID=97485 /ORGANISM="Prymnesium parvum, Strain Texoma1" /LENGTH=110 /DNA_ID=CAMNT_0040714359 /DNA_START=271 /DNA_END=601 /DNA_ORIENTATION=-
MAYAPFYRQTFVSPVLAAKLTIFPILLMTANRGTLKQDLQSEAALRIDAQVDRGFARHGGNATQDVTGLRELLLGHWSGQEPHRVGDDAVRVVASVHVDWRPRVRLLLLL